MNEAKSAVARPWERKFLGYSTTSISHGLRTKIAPESITRLRTRLKELLRQGRGRSLAHTIETVNPVLRGWMTYFRLCETRRAIEDLDAWVRRRMRVRLWRQWKRPKTREQRLIKHGIAPGQAWKWGCAEFCVNG